MLYLAGEHQLMTGSAFQRLTRYQGAVVRDDHILLLRLFEHASGRHYWVLPGGGRENGESEEACIRRELLEETHLHVSVDSLLFDEPAYPGTAYTWRKTFLCTPLGGDPRPGEEPEVSDRFTILATRWLSLKDLSSWEEEITNDQYLLPQLEKLRETLGYE